MSDQTAPTYLEPLRDELDRLRTLLDDRSAALNRTAASNDTMRATLARIDATLRLIAPEHITPHGARLIRAALADQEAAK